MATGLPPARRVRGILAPGNRVRVVECFREVSTVDAGYEGVIAESCISHAYPGYYVVLFEDGNSAHGHFLMLESSPDPSPPPEEHVCAWCEEKAGSDYVETRVCAACTVTDAEAFALIMMWRERLEAGTHDCAEERVALLRWARVNHVLERPRTCHWCRSDQDLKPLGGIGVFGYQAYGCYSCIAKQNGWNTQKPTPPDPPSGTPSWPGQSSGPNWED